MGLAETVLNAVQSAKNALGNLAIAGSLTKQQQNAHVPGQATSFTSVSNDVSLVITSFKSPEIDGDRILAHDAKIIILHDQSVIPEKGDLISLRGRSWRIVSPEYVYAGSEIAFTVAHARPQSA